MGRWIKKGFRILIKGPGFVACWLFVNCFGWICYDRKYLKTRHFAKITDIGWQWAANDLLHRFFFRKNLGVRWPCSPYSTCNKRVFFDPEDVGLFNGFGNYFQAFDGDITIGKGTYIAKNVGLITANHDPTDPDKHLPGKNIVLGEKCWIGMNAVILPGVTLGPHTVVGAGSVVTHSFPEGNCVIAGNPAKLLRRLDIGAKETGTAGGAPPV